MTLGTKITFEGEGDEADRNTIAGDIVFIIRDKPHPIFERSNSDLIYRIRLTLKQALLGTLLVIPFLDSSKPPYQLRAYKEVITPQTEKRFPNEGLPYPKDPTRRGNLIVKFDILFPKVFTDEQRALVDSCFANSMDFYDTHDSPLHTTILDSAQPQPPPPSSPLKPQASTHHRPHRYANGNGMAKSSVPPSAAVPLRPTKASPVRVSPPVSPKVPASAPTHATVF